jgi:hypothetical protein
LSDHAAEVVSAKEIAVNKTDPMNRRTKRVSLICAALTNGDFKWCVTVEIPPVIMAILRSLTLSSRRILAGIDPADNGEWVKTYEGLCIRSGCDLALID